MGLDTSHNCWHGPYGAFMRWRIAVCEAAGVELVQGASPEDPRAFSRPEPVWWSLEWPSERYEGEWPDGEPDDVLKVLIVHSDCEGWIRQRHTLPLSERLSGLLDRLSDDGPYYYHRAKCEQFIAGLRLAHERGEDVEFR